MNHSSNHATVPIQNAWSCIVSALKIIDTVEVDAGARAAKIQRNMNKNGYRRKNKFSLEIRLRLGLNSLKKKMRNQCFKNKI